jgi:hypothetical protein
MEENIVLQEILIQIYVQLHLLLEEELYLNKLIAL